LHIKWLFENPGGVSRDVEANKQYRRQGGDALLGAIAYLATCVEGLDKRSSERGPARLM
jgi:hypothetical protein